MGHAQLFYKGDLATFAQKAKKYVQIVFHKGALLSDESGLLEGDHPERRDAKFHNMEDVVAKKEALVTVVNNWVKFASNQSMRGRDATTNPAAGIGTPLNP